MPILLYFFIFLIAFIAMEGVAWLTHKYVMHGFLWNLHKDHHTGSNHTLEHNDWFALIFAVPSFIFIFLGLKNSSIIILCIGLGMTAYGIMYFFVHDVMVHQRIKLFRNLKSSYLKALRRAHKIHHKNTGKENGESFGFLIVSKKYFQQDNKSLLEK